MSEVRLANPGKVRAPFTAVLLLENPVKLSFGQLRKELKRIAPQAVLGGRVVGLIFALAILALWTTSALADSLILRVVEASTEFTPEPTVIVRFDDEGRKALTQFTTEHIGEDVEFMMAGRVLLTTRVHDPIFADFIPISGFFGAGEIVEVAKRIRKEGRIELNAIGRRQQ